MVSSSRTESLAQRFAAYTEELHDYFRSRHIPFGTKQDLEAFPARLGDGPLQEEMVSMVRSIAYREHETIPHAELATLLAHALAGPDLEEAAKLSTGFEHLSDFVTYAVRSQRFGSPADFTSDEEITATAAVAAAINPLPWPAAAQTEQPPLQLVVTPESPASPTLACLPAAMTPTAVQPIASISQAASNESTNDRLSRALLEFGERKGEQRAADQSVPEPAQATRPAFRSPTPDQPAYPSSHTTKPHAAAAFLRTAYWLPGLCALLLVLGVAFFLRRPRTLPLPSPPAAALPLHAVIEQPAKPSAGEPVLQSGQSHQHPTDSAEPATSATPPTAAAPAFRNRIVAQPRSSAPRAAEDVAVSPPKHTETTPGPAFSRVTPRVLGGREGVFLASSGAMAAHLLAAPAPHYPKLASLTHVEGEVIVQVVVGRDGGVKATRSLEGPRLLRGAAEHAIRHWRYRPYLVDGKPTDVATLVTVNFRLTH